MQVLIQYVWGGACIWGMRDQTGHSDRQGKGPQLCLGSAGDLGAAGHRAGPLLNGRQVKLARYLEPRGAGGSTWEEAVLTPKPKTCTGPSPPPWCHCKPGHRLHTTGNDRSSHEAVLFFYHSGKSVVLILFLNKLDMDNNFLPLREVGVSCTPHIQHTHTSACNVSMFQAREAQDCCNGPLLSSSWVGVQSLP